MREWLRTWLMRSWRGPVDLDPQVFWLYLASCWGIAAVGFWSYLRSPEALDLVMGVPAFALGLQALWVLVRRRRSRQ